MKLFKNKKEHDMALIYNLEKRIKDLENDKKRLEDDLLKLIRIVQHSKDEPTFFIYYSWVGSPAYLYLYVNKEEYSICIAPADAERINKATDASIRLDGDLIYFTFTSGENDYENARYCKYRYEYICNTETRKWITNRSEVGNERE